ncbi:hypothetical protein O6P37_14380 [Mycobacterium sp. CPCC 205372]|uniref:Uncharacterized protein n=2 Tax=Mycobacterium hippophais TaxID=3016340 RepID=A0ABT4PU40_9MYCO|nr:hypothetical protein [Mycobacterium hippophais]MCZ8380056.1 hypothetical protein [Mycobacterium hippophais]
MMALLRKLFRIGKLPDDMRAQVEAEGVIFCAEFLGAVVRFTGRVPGRRSVGLVRGYGGALALTNQRVIATLSAIPGKAGRSVDQPWTAAQNGMVAGTLSETGLLLDIPDLAVVHPEFSGRFSLTYKTALTADVLSRIPTRTIGFDVPPKFVYSALGIPRG